MRKHSREFSKWLLCQESVLIWIITITVLILAFVCVFQGFDGSFPWLTAMVGLPWAAYGTSQSFYYSKSRAENTEGGIKFETTMRELEEYISDEEDNYG